MSHDIRTPINGIMGMLNIGDHFPEDMEKQAECREKIRGASSFLFELVNDVLDMSKMESGKIELEEVPFDLLDLLDEVVSMIEVQAMGHGLDFIYERHEEIHRQVIGSPVHLRQILMNIAGNAVNITVKMVRSDWLIRRLLLTERMLRLSLYVLIPARA